MPSKTITDWKNIGIVALGAFCYSTLIIFTRLTHGLDSLSIAFFRSLFACLFFAVMLLWYREPLQLGKYRDAIGWLIALGAAVGVTAALYVYAIQHTTAANASLLVNSSPIYIAFLAPWVLKEKRPRFTWISLALLMIGVALITGITQIRFEMKALDGILAGILSGFTYAVSMILSRKLRGRVSGFTQTLWGTGVAMLILLPFALQSEPGVVLANLPILIPLGIISLGIASFLYYFALQKLKAQVVSVVAILEPVCGVLIGLLLFNEVPTSLGLVGIALILASIYLISRE